MNNFIKLFYDHYNKVCITGELEDEQQLVVVSAHIWRKYAQKYSAGKLKQKKAHQTKVAYEKHFKNILR